MQVLLRLGVLAILLLMLRSEAVGEAGRPRLTAAIDKHLLDQLHAAKVKPSPKADDAEFLRRAYLDITGKIPTAEKAAAFLDNTDPERRAKLIDELLDSTDYGRHLAVIWRTMLVKRDEANALLDSKAFTEWLAKSFNDNRGWDKIVADLLTADGKVEDNAATFFFLTNRDMNKIDPPKVVGATVNLFMGIQMQCAECHNHPFQREWKQKDFWGMAAFFSRTRDAGNPKSGSTITEAQLTVKAPKKGEPVPAKLPPGTIAIPSALEQGKTVGMVQAKFFRGEEPTLEEQGPFRPVFAGWLTSAKNPYFPRAMVNRTWAHFFGRGLVNPIDDMHDDNEPSHPEVLKLLADDFAATGFDLKQLIRTICNSEAYQRTSRPLPENENDEELFSRMKVKVMTAEVLFDSLALALGTEELFPVPAPNPKAKTPPPTSRQLFVKFFDTREEGDDPGESGHGIPQFLRLMNAEQFNRGSPLVGELAEKKVTTEQAIEQIFLATLSRRPRSDEVQKLSAYVAKQQDVRKGYAGALWILINSGEFLLIR